jgi:hypothetical protein
MCNRILIKAGDSKRNYFALAVIKISRQCESFTQVCWWSEKKEDLKIGVMLICQTELKKRPPPF